MSDIRLVIWDLDETFWSGTLTEGGIAYRQAHHDIVMALCRRGVMSAICSKNDLDPVREILTETGLWDYFVFPSIDWTDKGRRIAAIVAAARLRPESILFIDDNPTVRAQAEAAVPGLRVADESVISGLLTDPALRGKDDAGLTRLKHYKQLETRHRAAESGGDTRDFLRESEVTVEIVYDVETHIDRAVELINRTNQLNFTKWRLPDDPVSAAAALRQQIAPWYVKAGLVRVRDRYGDYGLCGIFLVEGLVAWGTPRLKHFAFSCHTLGLGVEQWVYALLGQPGLEIVGAVSSDLSRVVDWINVDRSISGEQGSTALGMVRIRGGCELEVLEHFFRASASTVTTEVVTPAGGILFRPTSHSGLLYHAARPLRPDDRALLPTIGMDASFHDTCLFDACEDGTLIVYSPSTDANLPRFRHRSTGLEVPIWFRDDVLPNCCDRPAADALAYDRIVAQLANDYDAVPIGDPSNFAKHYEAIVSRVPTNALLVVVLPNRWHNAHGVPAEDILQRKLNMAFRAAAKRRTNVRFVEMETLVRSIDEVGDSYLHFDRAVYFRLYEAICAAHRDWRSSLAETRSEPWWSRARSLAHRWRRGSKR